MEHSELAPGLRICRVLNGMWQVSGAHGDIDPERAVEAMFAYQDAGFTTWDLADHYGPAEDFIGAFRRRLRHERPGATFEAFTKWVPMPGPVNEAQVARAIERSLRRMDTDAIDLLQFHWWDYEDERYLDALRLLAKLRERGLIRHLGLTNFDTAHLRLIVERGIPVVSNQVQHSLVDRRPEGAMAAFCHEHGIGLLQYGSLMGGFLTGRFLGAAEPTPAALNTASLRKYRQMIGAWGNWELFQDLLAALDRLARSKRVSIANVAVRYVLQQTAVAGVIVGARLGVSEHLDETAQVFSFTLEAGELQEVEAVLSRGNDLQRVIGDCGDEYRR